MSLKSWKCQAELKWTKIWYKNNNLPLKASHLEQCQELEGKNFQLAIKSSILIEVTVLQRNEIYKLIKISTIRLRDSLKMLGNHREAKDQQVSHPYQTELQLKLFSNLKSQTAHPQLRRKTQAKTLFLMHYF